MVLRKRTLAACLLTVLFGLGGVALVGTMTGCGGAAKQTNTNTNTGANSNNGGSAESQPSK